MSFEHAICSPGLVEDYSQTSSLGTGQLSLLSGMDTPAKSCENVPQKDGSPACMCGKGTLDCSIHPSTPEAWIASMRDSLARTLALLESRQVYLREPDQVFTEKSCALLALFDRDSCSWKTLQQSLVTDSEPYSQTWPRWGMTAGGSAYAHPMSERRITETDGLSWIPTPTGSDPQLERRAKHGEHFTTATGTVRRKNEDGSSSMLGLAGFVRMYPTPNASDSRDRGNMSMPSIQRRAAIGKQLNLSMVVSPISGALNPDWVGWLMGFPMEWAKAEGK